GAVQRLPVPDSVEHDLRVAGLGGPGQLHPPVHQLRLPPGALEHSRVRRRRGGGQRDYWSDPGRADRPEAAPARDRAHGRLRAVRVQRCRSGHPLAVHLRPELRPVPRGLLLVRSLLAALDHGLRLGDAGADHRLPVEGHGLRGHRLPRRAAGPTRGARRGRPARWRWPVDHLPADHPPPALPGHVLRHGDHDHRLVPGLCPDRRNDRWWPGHRHHHAVLVRLRTRLQGFRRRRGCGSRSDLVLHPASPDSGTELLLPTQGPLPMSAQTQTQRGAMDSATDSGSPAARPPARRRSRGGPMRDSTLRKILLYIALAVAGGTFIIPIYWVFSSAVKTNSGIYQYPPDWFPWPLVLENFAEAWQAAPFNN